MDEMTRQALDRELEDAVRQKEELEAVIAYLARRLGREVPGVTASSGAISATPSGPIGDPASVVSESQYFGMSGPKAALALLKTVGKDRPLKTDEIFRAVKKGGVSISSGPVLYRSMTRDKRFRKVGKGRWGLAEWYPNAMKLAPSKGPADSEEAPAEAGSADDDQGAPGGAPEPQAPQEGQG